MGKGDAQFARPAGMAAERWAGEPSGTDLGVPADERRVSHERSGGQSRERDWHGVRIGLALLTGVVALYAAAIWAVVAVVSALL